jgi:hypothetical protein
VSSVSSDLNELIPLAMVIAISPLSVIPGILVLGTPRPKPTSLAFLVGWMLGIFVVTGAFVGGTDISNDGLDTKPSWGPYVRIAIGVALIGFALYRWFGRTDSAAHNPKWMTLMTSISPARAFVTALMLTVVNVKVFVMCAAAGAAIGTAALGRAGAWQATILFTMLAASTVALPVLAYQFAGARLDAPLAKVKHWMERNHTALVVGILLVIGAGLVYKGIHAL